MIGLSLGASSRIHQGRQEILPLSAYVNDEEIY